MARSKDPMNQRSRKFCLTSYHPVEIIEGVLKNRPVRAAVYIVHDKDVYTEADEKANPEHVAGTSKDEHVHILLCTNNAATLGQVRRWFPANQNTLGQVLNDDEQMLRYLTHKDDPDKAQYSDDEVITYGEGREPFLRAAVSSGRDSEALENLIRDIIAGVPYMTLARRYGRDIAIHWRQYDNFARMVYHQERTKKDKAQEEWEMICELHDRGIMGEYEFLRYKQAYEAIPSYLPK